MTHTFDDKTTAEEAATFFAGEIKGQVVLVTGASPGGLGAEACRAIAKYGAKLVILAGRNKEKLLQLEKAIKEESPSAAIRLLIIDQASLASVRQAAAEVNAYAEPIDVLINGGATMMAPYQTTVDGFESQFGTNHLGHFLFTNLIHASLIKSQHARVVNISSAGHRFGDVSWDDVGFSGGATYDKVHAYAQSKTANMLFTVELAKRWQSAKFATVSVHPGAIQTNLGRHLTEEDYKAFGVVTDENGKWIRAADYALKSIPEGAATYVVAAFDPDLDAHSGAYMSDCQVAPQAALPRAVDPVNAERLWKMSEEM